MPRPSTGSGGRRAKTCTIADIPPTLVEVSKKLVRISAKVVWHARRVISQMAEVAVPRDLFGEIPRPIAQLRRPPLPAQ